MAKGGVKKISGSRDVIFYQFGGTTGPARYPLFTNKLSPTGVSMLPRPVTKSRPGELGHSWMTNTAWLIKFTKDVARITLHYLSNRQDPEASFIIHKIEQCIFQVHESVRICGTYFTQLIMVGSYNKYDRIKVHLDKGEYITAVVTFGATEIKGGYTVYSNGISDNNPGKIQHAIEFRHGRIQMGNFSEVYHGVSPYIGTRFSFVFSMKQNLVDHFVKFQSLYYKQFVDAGFPNHMFIAN